MGLGPFDLTGGPFLQLYGILLVLTLIAGLLIPAWLRPDGRETNLTNPDDLAYLAGGKARFGDAVVARLLSAHALVMVGKNRFEPDPRHRGATAAERDVLALSSPAKWSAVEHAATRHAGEAERRLIAGELLMDSGTAWQLRFFQTLPYFLLIAFGLIKWEVGVSRDKPVGFLTVLLIVTAVFALIRFVLLDRRTKGGKRTLADARRFGDRMRRAPTTDEMGMAVALFGTTVLAGSMWGDYHKLRAASGDSGTSGGDSGSSSSDGGGSSGCGGGGCGGCGGG